MVILKKKDIVLVVIKIASKIKTISYYHLITNDSLEFVEQLINVKVKVIITMKDLNYKIIFIALFQWLFNTESIAKVH